MKFSLFLNTRQRTALLSNLLRSIDGTISGNNDIEILLGIDDDDIQTCNFIQNLDLVLPDSSVVPNIVTHTTTRPDNLHIKMNDLAEKSSGDFLFVLNDDVEFLTPSWDEIVRSKFKSVAVKDGIYYIGIHDTSIDKPENKQYSSFPALTREAYVALGYFMSENFVGLGADVHLWRIFNEVGRIIDMPEVVLDHVRHNTLEKVVSPDGVATHMRENTRLNPVDEWNVDISQEVGRLNEQITRSI